jgi:hypothetical protein
LQEHCDEELLLSPSFNSANIMLYGSKTCSNCRTILMLLSIERFVWCIFILVATLRICKAAKYEPAKSAGCLYTSFNTRFCHCTNVRSLHIQTTYCHTAKNKTDTTCSVINCLSLGCDKTQRKIYPLKHTDTKDSQCVSLRNITSEIYSQYQTEMCRKYGCESQRSQKDGYQSVIREKLTHI